MIRIALIAGISLVLIGCFGIFFPQLFGQAGRVNTDDDPLVVSESNPQKAAEGRPEVSTIDRIVVAGIVLPAGAGLFFIASGFLGNWISKTQSWFYVGVMGALPGALMILLSGERIADWFRVPWSVHWIPVLQLLLGAIVCAVAGFQFIQNGLPAAGRDNESDR